MSRITLPYNLQDGQKAYAARVMADFAALTGMLNQVSVDGLAPGDLENVLLQLKLLVDEVKQDQDRSVSDLSYDPLTRRLELRLMNGALYQLDMSPFLNLYLGSQSDTVAVSVDGAGRIGAQVRPGSLGENELSAALRGLINGKVTAGAAGNAAQIRFSDGDSFQDKLDAGALHGADAVSVALEGMYYFRYDPDNGHLYLGVADGVTPPPLSVNGSGHLIYTIE
ncbi:MAG: hypothetical protein IK116_08750 [Firmicutes bacterium]|nr:hypothetical protein [Bacillota bacterium]